MILLEISLTRHTINIKINYLKEVAQQRHSRVQKLIVV